MGPHEFLNNYLHEVSGTTFQWGVHDCFTFTNGAFKAMYGKGWADDWSGRYLRDGVPLGPRNLKKEFGWNTMEEGLDTKLARLGPYPPRGALVTTAHAKRWVTGSALGVCVGDRCAFLGYNELIYLPITLINGAWGKE